MESDYSPLGKIPQAILPVALLLSLSLGVPARAAGGDPGAAQLIYTRILKGSTPEYISITVNSDGTGTYDGRQLADLSHPRALKLTDGTLRKIFSLAAGLNYFRAIDLESHKRVANLGQKTFTYEKDGQKSSAEFNYTLNKNAQELSDLFEKIAMVEQHIQTLEFAIKYDHLGLPRELLLIQFDLANRALAEPEMMVPTLEEIARNPKFLHLAQVRAQDILQRIQGSNP
jgi:hypothetical protein